MATLTSRSLGRPSDARTGKRWAVFLVAGALLPKTSEGRACWCLHVSLGAFFFLQPLGPGSAPRGIVLCCALLNLAWFDEDIW